GCGRWRRGPSSATPRSPGGDDRGRSRPRRPPARRRTPSDGAGRRDGRPRGLSGAHAAETAPGAWSGRSPAWPGGSDTPLARGGRGVIELDQLAELFGQVLDPAVDLGEVIEELEDHLDPRQVDAQVALEAHDRPEPADLRRIVTDLRAVLDGSDQTQALIPDE